MNGVEVTATNTAAHTARYAAVAAGASPEGTAAAYHPARVRQGGAAVRSRATGLSTLPAAHD